MSQCNQSRSSPPLPTSQIGVATANAPATGMFNKLKPTSGNSFFRYRQWFVNLRCMQVLKNRFALYVGGGILPDSDPEKEWLETEMKAKTLSDVIEKVYLTEQFAF